MHWASRQTRAARTPKISSGAFSDRSSFLQQFPSIRSQVGVNADGETQIAELVMEVGMEYFQGPDDFYATVATDIAGFNMHDQRPGLGLTGP
jgi:hypothetical protein